MKRILRTSSLAALAVIGILAGSCASEPESPEQVENRLRNTDVFATTSTLSAEAPTEKLPAKDPHAFTIGAVLPLTGSRNVAGVEALRGLQSAVGEINAAGGVNGQPIQLAVLDSRSDLDIGAEALGRFRDYGEAVLLVGDGPVAVAQAEKLADYKMVVGFLCDYVAGPKLTPQNGVRIYLNGDQEGRTIEGYVEAAGVDRVAVVHQNDLLSESNKQYLLYLFSGNHAIFTTEEGYSPEEQNFTLLGHAMLRVNTGVLILDGNGSEYGKILSAFETAGWQGMVLGYAGVAGLGTVSRKGRLASSAAYPLPDFAANPRTTESGRVFTEAYRVKFGADPGLSAAYAYDNIRSLAAAAKQAVSADPQKIRAAFIALHTYTGAAGRYDIKDDGDTEMPLRLLRADGQPLPPPVKPDALVPASQMMQLHLPAITQP